METISFSLPQFDGFYHSLIDISNYISTGDDDFAVISNEEYDNINWTKTNENIAKRYLDKWIEKNSEILDELGLKITFKNVLSPREYNFRTDECICEAEYNERALLHKFKTMAENNPLFPEFIKSNYSSYSRFVSFYSDDYKVWLGEYLGDSFDDVVFSGFLRFLTKELSDDDKIYDVMDVYYEQIEYN